VPILRAYTRQATQTEKEGPTVTLSSVFRKLMNPQHTTKSRGDCPETVHWHYCLHHRMPIDERSREGQVNGVSPGMALAGQK
jgi:hypothetical protein